MKHAERLKVRAYGRFGMDAADARRIALEALPETAQTIYNYLVIYKAEHDGISPTVQEIMTGARLASISNIGNHLAMLERAHLIKRLPGTSRGIMVTGGRWQMDTEAAVAIRSLLATEGKGEAMPV